MRDFKAMAVTGNTLSDVENAGILSTTSGNAGISLDDVSVFLVATGHNLVTLKQ